MTGNGKKNVFSGAKQGFHFKDAKIAIFRRPQRRLHQSGQFKNIGNKIEIIHENLRPLDDA